MTQGKFPAKGPALAKKAAPPIPESEWMPRLTQPPTGRSSLYEGWGGGASKHTRSTNPPERATLRCSTGVTGCCRGCVRRLTLSRGSTCPVWRILKYVKGYIMLGTQ